MTRVVPQTVIDKLLLAWRLVSNMELQLPVTNDLKDEAKDPDSHTNEVQPDQLIRVRVNLDVNCRRVANE